MAIRVSVSLSRLRRLSRDRGISIPYCEGLMAGAADPVCEEDGEMEQVCEGVLGASWGPLGSLSEASWGFLGAAWGLLGAS